MIGLFSHHGVAEQSVTVNYLVFAGIYFHVFYPKMCLMKWVKKKIKTIICGSNESRICAPYIRKCSFNPPLFSAGWLLFIITD